MERDADIKTVEDYKPLRPGEVKILRALQSKSKAFTTLKEETGLQQNALSNYLKRLQKIRVINKDIDTRFYELCQVSVEVLFYNDIADFLQKRVKMFTSLGQNHAQFVNLSLWTAITDKEEMKKLLGTINENTKLQTILSKLAVVLSDFGKSCVLSLYEKNAQETILMYERLLLEYVRIFKIPEPRTKAEYNFLLDYNKEKLEHRFPNCEIPEQMVKIETEREYRRMQNLQDRLADALFQPWDLSDVPDVLERMKTAGKCRQEISEKEKERLRDITAFLEEPRNRRIFEKFRQDLKEKSPKTLLFYASGFTGYVEQIKKLAEMEKTALVRQRTQKQEN